MCERKYMIGDKCTFGSSQNGENENVLVDATERPPERPSTSKFSLPKASTSTPVSNVSPPKERKCTNVLQHIKMVM